MENTRTRLQDIRREIERHDPTQPVAHASTPPSSWYQDADFHAFEFDAVFRGNWLFAGRAQAVREPGSFLSGRIGDESYLLVRDHTGELRAFYNVCRHHAAILCEPGVGCAEVLTCPYHGWSYHLDGRLKSAPRMGAMADFDVTRFGLRPMPVAQWRGFVFVHLGALERIPPDTTLPEIGLPEIGLPEISQNDPSLNDPYAELGRWLDGTDERDLVHVGSRSYEIACNWKVFVDNYLDGGYHVPHAHGELASQLSMKEYRTSLFDRYSIQWCPGRDARIGDRAIYAWLYPNFMINRYGPAMDTNLVLPLGPERCLVVFDFYFAETLGEAAQGFIERSLESADITQREDVAICESVQRGLRSSAYDRGRFAPELEIGEHHFHGLLAADLRARLERDPNP